MGDYCSARLPGFSPFPTEAEGQSRDLSTTPPVYAVDKKGGPGLHVSVLLVAGVGVTKGQSLHGYKWEK